MTKITGGCSCGSVKYEIEGEILGGAVCYCDTCQRVSGGAPNYALAVSDFELSVTGNPSIYSHPGGTGAIVEKVYCGGCGVHVYAQGGANNQMLRVKAGSLDDSSLFSPMVQVWTSEAKHWHILIPDLPSFEKNLPGMAGDT